MKDWRGPVLLFAILMFAFGLFVNFTTDEFMGLGWLFWDGFTFYSVVLLASFGTYYGVWQDYLWKKKLALQKAIIARNAVEALNQDHTELFKSLELGLRIDKLGRDDPWAMAVKAKLDTLKIQISALEAELRGLRNAHLDLDLSLNVDEITGIESTCNALRSRYNTLGREIIQLNSLVYSSQTADALPPPEVELELFGVRRGSMRSG